MANEILELHRQASATKTHGHTMGQDRRNKGRARVSREMRIQAADFRDGKFEEVRSTQNISRDGLYFLTPHDRYYKGMRVRVTAAAERAAEGALENVGEVVRVQRHGNSFGVAVALAGRAGRPCDSPAAGVPAGKGERRSAKRQTFIASTEMIDVHSGERSRVRTTDLSTQGCYIDTLNPLPAGMTVRLQIEKENATVEFRARVISSHTGSGMGLAFEGITQEQRAMLARWLRGDIAQHGITRDAQTGTTEAGEDTFDENPRFTKLLELLTSKGILKESEVESLLRDI